MLNQTNATQIITFYEFPKFEKNFLTKIFCLIKTSTPTAAQTSLDAQVS